jgi:hypothetical protein
VTILTRTARNINRHENRFDLPQIIFAWSVVLAVVAMTLWINFGPSHTEPITAPAPSSTVRMHDLQGLSIPIANNWATVGNEETLTVQDTNCHPNDYGKGCSELIVVVKTSHSDPDDFMQAYEDSCKKKMVRHGERKIGFRLARYYVIDRCVLKSNTASDQVRSLWYIQGHVFVLETHAPGQKRMAGVDDALAGAVWQ